MSDLPPQERAKLDAVKGFVWGFFNRGKNLQSLTPKCLEAAEPGWGFLLFKNIPDSLQSLLDFKFLQDISPHKNEINK